MIVSLVSWIARMWKGAKRVGLILWQARFILFVLAAFAGLLQVDQAQDVLFHIFAEASIGQPLLLIIALAFSATQSWYWARFLLNENARQASGERAGSPLKLSLFEVRLPRFLGAGVFAIAAFSIWRSGSGWTTLWACIVLVLGIIFYGLTVFRRLWLNREIPGADRGEQEKLTKRFDLAQKNKIERMDPPKSPSSLGLDLAVMGWIFCLFLSALTSTVPPWGLARPALLDSAAGFLIVAAALGSIALVRTLDLPAGTKRVLWTLFLVNAVTFGLSAFNPVGAGTWLGSGPALVVATGVWIGTTSFFVAYPGLARRIPMTLIFLALISLGAWLGERNYYDNHTIRGTGASIDKGTLDSRATLATALEEWEAKVPCDRDPTTKKCKDKTAVPMVIVAAEGGASRAGYWTAMVLGALEDAMPGFHQSVFAISGVSGGSVGATVYQQLVANYRTAAALPCGKVFDEKNVLRNSYAECARQIMRVDFLGPTLFNMFNADLGQRILPGAAFPDRAFALESAWEKAFATVLDVKDTEAANPLKRTFALRSQKYGAEPWTPILLLNGTSAKTGRRIITSDIAISPSCNVQTAKVPDATKTQAIADAPTSEPIFLGATDFFCLTRRQTFVSTAAHNSARFPYVSPGGTIWAQDGEHLPWKADRIVDGGYFETHGALTALDVVKWVALQGYKPIVLALDNDLAPFISKEKERDPAYILSKKVGPEADAMSMGQRFSDDLLTPLKAFSATRSGHGDYATEMLRHVTNQIAAQHFVRLNIELGQGDLAAVDPAMSWFLSERSIRSMDYAWCPHLRPAPPGKEAKGEDVAKRGAERLPSAWDYDFRAEMGKLKDRLRYPQAPNAPASLVCRAIKAQRPRP